MASPPPSSHTAQHGSERPLRGTHRQAKSQRRSREIFTSFGARLVVGLCAGLLFAIGINLTRGTEGRYGSDLQSLIQAKESEVAKLREENTQLQQTVDELQKSTQVVAKPKPDDARASLVGPGLKVTLTDAPIPEPLPPSLNADDLVIHQQDIEAVFNALWAGGAEAIAIQGMRVQMNSQVSCVGNVININGQVFSPPYEITAIGDSEQMREKLYQDEQIKIIQQYVARYNLGFTVKGEREIVMNRQSGDNEIAYAKVLRDV